MISEFTAHAKPTNNKAKVAFITMLVLSAIDFIAYVLMGHFGVQKSGLVGVMTLVFITAAVYYYTRYIGSSYYYEITTDSFGTPIFVVNQKTGKRSSTLCRVNIADIHKAVRETRAESKAHKTPFGFKKYVYVPTLIPNETYRLTSVSRYEKAEIVIEATEEFVSILLRYSVEAREMRATAEEDDY